jgi:rfaE bifunctional protein nucleotidyltransferase chain/domain
MNPYPEKSKMDFDAVIQNKIVNREQLRRMIAVWRMKSKRIVFTNGCFDLLHPGHLHLLHKARSFGDILIAGLNSDSSVSKLKPGRPFMNELSRSKMIASLEVVDAVILFAEETPGLLIDLILPDVLVKGSDYKTEDVIGKQTVESHGGTVELIDLLPGFSTSSLIEKIRGATK